MVNPKVLVYCFMSVYRMLRWVCLQIFKTDHDLLRIEAAEMKRARKRLKRLG